MQASSIVDEIYNVPPASLALALIIVVISIVYYAMQYRGVPPGPVGLPYFGYFPFFYGQTVHLQLEELKKKYGEVFSFTSFGRLFINLGSTKIVRETYITKSDCFAGRYDDYAIINHIFGDGVVCAKGESWRTLRKFFLQVFKERGMVAVKDAMSGTLYDSIKATIEDIKAKNGESINITEIMGVKCNTIFRQTLFGENGVTDEQILEINKFYGNMQQILQPINFLLFGPFARFFMYPLKSKFRKGFKNHAAAKNMLFKLIQDHKSTYDEENIRDIIDEFYKEKNKRETKGDPTAKYFTDGALLGTLIQFVGDGALTVASFVTVFLKHITERPEEQEKMYKEIMEVVGEDRQPTIEDKSKLTYLNAFINEVERMSDFVPFFPSLECSQETTLGGYRIPKAAITITNMYSSHFDPETYEEPEKFNPSRFIAKDGKRECELPITFGIGKRSCIGEGFVMLQTFLFLATIIQNFRLSVAENNLSTAFEIITQRQFFVHAEPRKHK